MEYPYIIGICIVNVIVLVLLFRQIRKWHARRKVSGRSDYEKVRDLDRTLGPYGFLFDPAQGIFFSKMDAWQREYGYCHLYDELAPMLNMVMDCEPVTFEYDDRHWMIEFWKGQYGMLSGAEIGVYVAEQSNRQIPKGFTGRFYECVSNDERLCMNFILRKDRQKILERKGYHWWLTGFALGEFVRPRQLVMEWEIMFPNVAMRKAFLKGLERIGYQFTDFRVDVASVRGVFAEPKTKQPRRRNRLWTWLVQGNNRRNCRYYLNITKRYERTLDKLDYLRFCFPRIYRIATSISRAESIAKVSKRVKPYN